MARFVGEGAQTGQIVPPNRGHLFFFFFLLLHLWHMEVPGPGAEWELQPLAHTTAMVTPDPSHVFNLMPKFAIMPHP